jgi:hypothetical protein
LKLEDELKQLLDAPCENAGALQFCKDREGEFEWVFN